MAGRSPLAIDDSGQQDSANTALYQVTTTPNAVAGSSGALQAPAEVDFTWSDGHLAVTKKLKFDSSYIATFEIEVRFDGQPVQFSAEWLGGFGDNTAYQPAVHTQVFYSLESKLQLLSYKNLGQPKEPERKQTQSGPPRLYRRRRFVFRGRVFAAARNDWSARGPAKRAWRRDDADGLDALARCGDVRGQNREGLRPRNGGELRARRTARICGFSWGQRTSMN